MLARPRPAVPLSSAQVAVNHHPHLFLGQCAADANAIHKQGGRAFNPEQRSSRLRVANRGLILAGQAGVQPPGVQHLVNQVIEPFQVFQHAAVKS